MKFDTLTLILVFSLVSGIAPGQASPKAPSMVVLANVPDIDAEAVKQISDSLNRTKLGTDYARHSDWTDAKQCYQEAIALWKDNPEALYGLAEYSERAGDVDKAVKYYRRAVYGNGPGQPRFKESNADKLMEFAILLNKSSQVSEALYVYHHTADGLNFEDSDNRSGKAHLRVLLPEFGVEAGKINYTSERLQAMAQVAIAIYVGVSDQKKTLALLRGATRLYPTSAVAQYYLAERLVGMGDAKGAQEANDRATALGLDQLLAATREARKSSTPTAP